MDVRKLKDKGYDAYTKRKYDKALKYFTEALKKDPTDIRVQQRVADILVKVKKIDEAVKIYKQVASLYAKKGFLMQAIGVYKLILQVEPNADDVKELLSELYADRKEPEETVAAPSIISDKMKDKKEKIDQQEEDLPEIQEESDNDEEFSEADIDFDEAGIPDVMLDGDSEESQKEEEPEQDEESVVKEPEPEQKSVEVEEEELDISMEDDFDVEVEVPKEDDIDNILSQFDLEKDLSINDDEMSELLDTLPKIQLFSQLKKEEFHDIIDQVELKKFNDGDVIIKEDDTGKDFYLIVEGEVEILKNVNGNNIPLATLGEGSFFGEFAFLTGAKRSASVVSSGVTNVIEFTEDMMNGIIKKYPHIAEVLVEFYRERILSTMLAISPLFQHFDPSDRRTLIDQFEFIEFAEDKEIIKEGDEGDGMYLIMFGKVKVTKKGKSDEEVELATLKEGDFFGEISLLTKGPRTASIITLEKTGVFKLSSNDFNQMIMMYPQILEVTYSFKEKREVEMKKMFSGNDELNKMGIV